MPATKLTQPFCILGVWWKFLSWRGWEILGRMSLSIYLIHWLFSLTLLAQRTNANRASVFDIVRLLLTIYLFKLRLIQVGALTNMI